MKFLKENKNFENGDIYTVFHTDFKSEIRI